MLARKKNCFYFYLENLILLWDHQKKSNKYKKYRLNCQLLLIIYFNFVAIIGLPFESNHISTADCVYNCPVQNEK